MRVTVTSRYSLGRDCIRELFPMGKKRFRAAGNAFTLFPAVGNGRRLIANASKIQWKFYFGSSAITLLPSFHDPITTDWAFEYRGWPILQTVVGTMLETPGQTLEATGGPMRWCNTTKETICVSQ